MSNYSEQKSWGEWLYGVEKAAQDLFTVAEYGRLFYDKWYKFTYGKTNAEVAAMLGITEQKVTDVQYCLGVFNDLNNFINNGAVTTTNRKGYLISFI